MDESIRRIVGSGGEWMRVYEEQLDLEVNG
jgi:hypothetical protein